MRLKRERLTLDYIDKRNQLLPPEKEKKKTATKMTTVFVHAYPVVGDDLCQRGRTAILIPEQAINIYKSEKDANEAYDRVGGIVVETTADKLKGRIDGASASSIAEQKREDARGPQGCAAVHAPMSAWFNEHGIRQSGWTRSKPNPGAIWIGSP